MANIQVISERAQRFGGLNFILQSKEHKKILELCDKELGVRSSSGAGYSYSEVINACFSAFYLEARVLKTSTSWFPNYLNAPNKRLQVQILYFGHLRNFRLMTN